MNTTAIGSVPWTDADEAVRRTWGACTWPFWPQMPRRSWRELMIPQYAEGLPGARFNDAAKEIVVERDTAALETFIEAASEDPLHAGKMSDSFAAGLPVALEAARKAGGVDTFKTHTTGPLTFTLSVKFGDGEVLFSEPAWREAAVLLLVAKSLWQMETFRPYCRRQVLFFDEPFLAASGSHPVLTPATVEETLTATLELVRARAPEATLGVHCCGNTDWAAVLSAPIDVLSFDAYSFGKNLLLYPDEVGEHIRRGGTLAFGIVPTSDAAAAETAHGLRGALDRLLDGFSAKGVEVPPERVLVTPACGTGSLSEELAERVFALLSAFR